MYGCSTVYKVLDGVIKSGKWTVIKSQFFIGRALFVSCHIVSFIARYSVKDHPTARTSYIIIIFGDPYFPWSTPRPKKKTNTGDDGRTQIYIRCFRTQSTHPSLSKNDRDSKLYINTRVGRAEVGVMRLRRDPRVLSSSVCAQDYATMLELHEAAQIRNAVFR